MLQAAHDLGFAGVELAVFAEKETGPDRYPWVVVDQLSPAERTKLRALVGRFPIVTTHLPYRPALRPLAKDAEIREQSRRELHRSLKDSAFWGAKVANIHLISEPGVAFAEAKSELVALYRELADVAHAHGIRLAIETTRPYRCSEFIELIHAIDHPAVGGTVDTGHLHFFRSELPVVGADRATPEGIRRYNDFMLETLASLGPKLFHIHFNDLRVADWREHFVPGTGIIDWPRFFGFLERTEYRGALVAELLYYQGANDTGAMLTRAFTQKTPDGAVQRGLQEMNTFLRPFFG
jgi:sugar phosphate isomerase/epimerase